jgi:hypothetical protein
MPAKFIFGMFLEFANTSVIRLAKCWKVAKQHYLARSLFEESNVTIVDLKNETRSSTKS